MDVALEIREQLDTKDGEWSKKDDELRWLETENHGLREQLCDLHDAVAERDVALAKLHEAKKQLTERDATSTELEKLTKQLTESGALA
ncbi:hypothetical protein GUJ93_ZPchr0006g42200 [Zizania palustris]|uniref:Uncharacterized protein n=1 Tax=Zizania palustris TaxID=103762 RepID=A0A8J5VGJ9_ZIZPA|nr:hypothetical protein GUJ93_ZPchr0006g42200 [Zizania palustris]